MADLAMRMSGIIVTSFSIFDVPDNLLLPFLISMAISNRFRLAELAVFVGSSESTFAFPVFIYVTLLPTSSSCP